MIVLRIPEHLFRLLREAFDGAADYDDAPIERAVLERVRAALAEAARQQPPGLPVVVELLDGGELFALQGCWEVGSEAGETMPEDVWDQINALLAQASLQA